METGKKLPRNLKSDFMQVHGSLVPLFKGLPRLAQHPER